MKGMSLNFPPKILQFLTDSSAQAQKRNGDDDLTSFVFCIHYLMICREHLVIGSFATKTATLLGHPSSYCVAMLQ